MVVPVNKVVQVLVTGADVIHSFTVPSFGVKHRRRPRPDQRDLVQGDHRRHLLRPVLRTLRQGPCLHADRGPGGKRSDFAAWVAEAKKKYAGADSVPPNTFAARRHVARDDQ